MIKTNEENQLLKLIRKFERKLEKFVDMTVSCCNVTIGQCNALLEIGFNENLSLIELSELLDLESSTMSRTVNSLVNKGLVKRDIDPDDRRYVAISLTDDGYKTYISIEESINLYFEEVYQAIPENKYHQIVESFEILLDIINNKECCK